MNRAEEEKDSPSVPDSPWGDEETIKVTAPLTEKLDRGEVVSFLDPATNRERVATKLVTPEFYKQYMAPGSAWKPRVGRMPQASPEAQAMVAEAVWNHWDGLEREAPGTAAKLTYYPELVFADAELAGALQHAETWAPLDKATEWLIENPDNVRDYESMEETLKSTQVTRAFLEKHGPDFVPVELDVIATGYAALPAAQREQLSAEADLWWRNRDKENVEDRTEFIGWFYSQALQKQDYEISRRSSPILDALDAPLRLSRDVIFNPIVQGMTWLSPATPNDVAHMGALTQGQQIALAMGIEPGEFQTPDWIPVVGGMDAFQTVSGTWDGAGYLWQDPIGWAAAVGVGAKVAKTVPAVGRLASGGRWSRVSKTMIPFLGRHAQPALPRGPIVRSMWAVFAKSQDEMLDAFGKAGGFDQMFTMISAGNGLSEVVERYPEFKGVVSTIGSLLQDAKSVDEVELIIRDGYKLGFIGEEGPGFLRVQDRVNELRKAHNAAVRTAADNGQLSAQGLLHLDQVDPRFVLAAEEAGRPVAAHPGLAANVATLESSGRKVLVFRKGTKVAKLKLEDLLSWGRSRQIDNPTGALSQQQIENLARNYDAAPEAIDTVEQYGRAAENLSQANVADTVQLSGRQVGSVAVDGAETPVFLHASETAEGMVRYDLMTGEGRNVASAIWSPEAGVMGGTFRTWDEFLEQGAQSTLWEAIAKVEGEDIALDGISRMGFGEAPTAAGAGALHRITQRLMDRATAGAPVRAAEALAEGRISGDQRLLDFLLDYMDARGIDVLDAGENGHILGRKGLEKAIEVVDDADLARPAELRRGAAELARSEAALRSMLASDNSMWVITDVPQFRARRPHTWKRHGSGNAKGWWGNFKRTTAARWFSPEAPATINLQNGAEGGSQLVAFLKQLGVSEDLIARAYNEFVTAPYENRYNVAMQAITEGAGEIDHPILRYGLVEFFRKEGVHSFGYAFGEEVGRAASTTRPGQSTALPWLGHHLAADVPLPGRDFFEMLSRYRSAKAQGKTFGGLGRMNVRGLTGKTRKARQAIAGRYRTMLERHFQGDIEALRAFDNDDLMAMAYATIYPDMADGVGKMANFMKTYPGGAWRALHSGFSRAQLALRPIAWPFKVVAIEEQIRGALFDLPSMYRNPVRMMSRWLDAYLVQRHAHHKARMVGWAEDIVTAHFPPGMKVDEALKVADTILPGFSDLGAAKKVTNINDVRALAGRELSKRLMESGKLDTIGSAGGRGTRLRRAIQHRLSKKGGERLKALGLPDDFDWGMSVPDIVSKGIVQLFAEEAGSSAQLMSYAAGAMTQRQVRQFGRALGGIWVKALEDPATGKWGLARAAARATGDPVAAEHSALAFSHTAEWRRIRANVVRILEDRGINVTGDMAAGIPEMTEVALVERYFEELVDPYVDDIFGVLWRDNPAEQARVATELLSGRTTVEIGGTKHTLNRADPYGATVAKAQALVVDADAAGRPGIPQSIAPMFDPRFAFDDDAGTLTHAIKNASNHLINFGGEYVTQRMNRRPAWLDQYDRWFKLYTGMGYPDDVARQVASQKATLITNYVYYNMDNATPVLRKFNRVMPFGAAAWEVFQTWFYKIPAQQGGGVIVGYPALARKVDRTFRALQEIGVITYEEDPETGEKDVYLNLATDPQTGNPVGDFVSKAGYNLAKAPAIVVEHMANIYNWITDSDIELTGDLRKGHMRYQVGNPIGAITGSGLDGESGIMAVNNFYFSLNPVAQYPLAEALNRIPGVVSESQVAGDGAKTLADLAAEGEVDPVELYRYNRFALADHMGQDDYNKLLRGDIAPEDVVLPEGISLAVPGSSLWEEWIIPTIYPFGKTDSVTASIYSMVPSTFQYAFRALGIWNMSGEDKFWTTDENGEIKLDSGFLEAFSTPMTKTQIASEIISQLQHLEASEGLLTQWAAEVDKLNRLMEEGVAAGLVFSGQEGNVTVTNPGEDPERARAFEEQSLRLLDLNSRIVKRATDNAGGSLLFRFLMGSLSPATPRMMYEEQVRIADYWNARDVAEGGADFEGGAMVGRLPRRGGAKSVADFNTLLTKFLEDPSGDAAKAHLRQNHPEIWAFSFGKTFWGPGGPPPEVEGLEEWAKQIESGDRLSMPFDVFMQRVGRAGLAMEREVALIERYGNDPVRAAIGILNDWEGYMEIVEESRTKYAGLDYFDEFANGGDYLAWKDRNRGLAPVFAEELNARFEALAEAAAEMEDVAPAQDMTIEERKEFTGILKNVARQYRDIVQAYRDDLDDRGWQSPRERTLSWYFDSVMAPYYEKLSELYEAVDNATDSEDRSRAFDAITEFQTESYLTRVFDAAGNEFPNPREWTWNKRTDEDKQQRRGKWIVGRPDWLDLQGTQELVAGNPALAEYLPTTYEELQDWKLYSQARDRIADMAEPTGPLGEPELTYGERIKAQQNLEAQLRDRLISQGREGELLWLEMYPVERLAVAGELPDSMMEWVESATWIRNRLAVEEVGPTSTVGRQLFGQVYQALAEAMAQDEQLRQDFYRIGELYYDEFTYDTIFARLMYGDTFGEV